MKGSGFVVVAHLTHDPMTHLEIWSLEQCQYKLGNLTRWQQHHHLRSTAFTILIFLSSGQAGQGQGGPRDR